MNSASDRAEAVQPITKMVSAGAHKTMACRELGIALSTPERWSQVGALKADGTPVPFNPRRPTNSSPRCVVKCSRLPTSDVSRTYPG